jgi:hypothetical protein
MTIKGGIARAGDITVRMTALKKKRGKKEKKSKEGCVRMLCNEAMGENNRDGSSRDDDRLGKQYLQFDLWRLILGWSAETLLLCRDNALL